MSENWLKFFPMQPEFAPEPFAIQRATDYLAEQFPLADEMRVMLRSRVAFIDQGGNFQRIICPGCASELDVEWWQEAMDRSYQNGFTNLSVTTPCCGAQTTLNDLEYDWPAGFARFSIELRGPGVPSVDQHILPTLEDIVCCQMRVIWAHL